MLFFLLLLFTLLLMNATVSFVIVADVSVDVGVTDTIVHLLLMLLSVLLLH